MRFTRWILPLLVAAATASPRAAGAEAPASAPSPKREVPDYDGRGPAPTTSGEAALWVPRVALSPVYLVTEYVLRRPLALAIPAAERADLPRKIYDFFTFGPHHDAGWVPVGFVEFGFVPTVGVYAFWNDALFAGHHLDTHVEVWPTDWYGASLNERIPIDSRTALRLRTSEIHRPDRVFYGIGPDTLQSNQSRYAQQTLDTGGILEWRFWRQSRVEAGAGLRVADIRPGNWGSDPSLEVAAANGAFPIPYGFERGYTVEYNKVRVVVDSRRPWPAFGDATTSAAQQPGSGVHVEAQAEEAGDARRSPGSAWIRYGATAGGYLDLNGHGRVLGLGVVTSFADPLQNGAPIPFPELAQLGGEGPMRGYYSGRLLGRSAAAATIQYVWPIAPWIGGTIDAAVGNAFDAHLSGFRPGRLRLSAATGLSTLGATEYPLELVVGGGSETFETGGRLDSFRLALLVNHGF